MTKKKTIGELLEWSRAMGEKAKERVPLPKNVVYLTLWPALVRAVPNGFLRSALFGAIAKGKRRYSYLEGEQLAALDGIDIRYTGQRRGLR